MDETLEPNRTTTALEPPRHSQCLRPDPRGLLGSTPVARDALQRFAGRSLIGVGELDRPMVVELCRFASILESVEISAYRPLWGKIIITAFFEASTRTRTSFESAALRLDGRVISIPDGQITGVKKGESLEDIGEMFNAYGDLVILRHTETDAPPRIRRNLRIPLINAGNGTGEHPTQALADWYALLKWRPELADPRPKDGRKIRLGILGTPGSMRAVKSFLLTSLLFREHIERIDLISEMADPFGHDLAETMAAADVPYEITNDVQEVLPKLDVIYMNSIAFLGDSYKKLDSRFKLDAGSNLKPDAVILHPLARLDELDPSLDDTRHNLYWTQAHGAVFLRQALFVAVFNRLGRLPENIPLS
jgi:aspartate carbamoyltransferase catalytic subunit